MTTAGDDVKAEIATFMSRRLDGYLELRRIVGHLRTESTKEIENIRINKLTRWVKWLKGENNSV